MNFFLHFFPDFAFKKRLSKYRGFAPGQNGSRNAAGRAHIRAGERRANAASGWDTGAADRTRSISFGR